MEKDASLTIRLPKAVKAALERAAEADARSVSSFTTIVLMHHLGLRDEAPPRPGVSRNAGRRPAAGRGAGRRSRPARP